MLKGPRMVLDAGGVLQGHGSILHGQPGARGVGMVADERLPATPQLKKPHGGPVHGGVAMRDLQGETPGHVPGKTPVAAVGSRDIVLHAPTLLQLHAYRCPNQP